MENTLQTAMNTKTQKKLKHQRGFPCTHCSNWKYNRAYCLIRATFRKMRCPNLSIFCRFKLLYIFGRSLLMFSEVRLNQRVFSNVVALSPSSGLWMLHTHGSFCVPQRLWLPSHDKFMHAIDKEIHYIIGVTSTSGCFTMFYYQAAKPPADFQVTHQGILPAVASRHYISLACETTQQEASGNVGRPHCIMGSTETSAYGWNRVTSGDTTRALANFRFPRMWYKFCATLTQTSRRGTFLVQCPWLA